jgi:hypothetical protein
MRVVIINGGGLASGMRWTLDKDRVPAKKSSGNRCPTFAMGAPVTTYDLDKALRIAATLEDDEITRTFAARK